MDKENFVLSNYEIKYILGQGTFSKVKLGINKKTNEKVAIKIIDKKKTLNKSNYDRIGREISILKNSYHPNIVKVLDTKEDLNNYYFIMEYCQYGELFLHIVNKKRLDEEEASFYFFQLISGLNYLHKNKIVHRDLKPENLLISKRKILKIIDFGLSNYTPENEYLNTPCGSPSYASPEMIKGKKYNGFLSDIWSCGVILYIMLYGYLPFEGFSNNDLFKKILKGKVNYPNYINKSAIDLMKNILVVNPEKRIDINKIKKHPFYLKGKNIFNEKFPELINDVIQNNINNVNKTLKKSLSDSINNFKITNKKNNNKINRENEKNCTYREISDFSNSENKNDNEKDINYLKKKKDLEKNNGNNVYSNLLFHTKNINYYKKILSTGKLNIHKKWEKKDQIDDNEVKNNEITPKKNMYEKKYYTNSGLSKYNLSTSKNSEIIPSKKNSKNSLTKNSKNSLTNSVNTNELIKDQKTNNLHLYLKNSPDKNIKIGNERENSNLIKNNNKEEFDSKKHISILSFNEKCLKSKYGCQTPNFLLLKKLLKNSQKFNVKDKKIDNIKESVVHNVQKETKIFNFNKKNNNYNLNKMKQIKRIYENKINNDTDNEIKKSGHFSTHNSNSNFKVKISTSKTKAFNDFYQNKNDHQNLKIKNNYNYINNNNTEISLIKKFGLFFKGFILTEKKNSNNKLSNNNSNRNTNNINNNKLIMNNKNYNQNSENNKEIYINKKKINIKGNNIYTKDNEMIKKNINHHSLGLYSPKNICKKNIKMTETEQKNITYKLTNINSSEKITISNKKKLKNKPQKSSNFIKVNKLSKSGKRNNKNNVKKNIEQQSSLTNKLHSIKKNFNLSNKDIFIFDDRKEDIINYLTNNNKIYNSTRSQKNITNSYRNTMNSEMNKKKIQNTSLIENKNNSNFSENQNNQLNQNNMIKKEICKSNKTIKNKYGIFNSEKSNKKILFNDENQNYNNKEQNRNNINYKKSHNFEKNALYIEYSNLEKKEINKKKKSKLN